MINLLDVKESDEHALDFVRHLSHIFLVLNASMSILMNKLLMFRYSIGHCGADGPTYVPDVQPALNEHAIQTPIYGSCFLPRMLV
jgi:predicted small lipoprotein YifL